MNITTIHVYENEAGNIELFDGTRFQQKDSIEEIAKEIKAVSSPMFIDFNPPGYYFSNQGTRRKLFSLSEKNGNQLSELLSKKNKNQLSEWLSEK